jgi:uncharacterized protein YdhG (YjbR/CyaY superfamily)
MSQLPSNHPFSAFVSAIEEEEKREKLLAILLWIEQHYPELEKRVAWNQPMFTHHGTFIIAFSVAKKHIAVAPERKAIIKFEHRIRQAGYEVTTMMYRYPFHLPIDFTLLQAIVDYNILDKKNITTFWRKEND